MARATILAALLQPALASFYTVTSFIAVSTTTSKLYATCTTNCRVYTDTTYIDVNPTATPTAKPLSSTTYTDSYDDVEVVSVFVDAAAVPSSDLLLTTPTYNYGVYTNYVVPVTWTAPASCPTPFTVVTYTDYSPPYEVTGHLSAASTATSVYTYSSSHSTVTYFTYFLAPTAVPSSVLAHPTSNYYYSNYVARCSNPTARYGSSSGSGSGGYHNGGDDSSDDGWQVCAVMTGCVSLATWVIVVATILPTIFVLGFVESYCWFRRLMLGKSALRLGTVCWCCLSLWVICVTRQARARSKEDQVLLRQYWATLGAGKRIKYWFKHGLAWRYPVELLGNPDGNNPVVVVPAGGPVSGFGGPPPPPPNGGMTGGDAEKNQVGVAQQPMYMTPYPGQQPYAPAPGGFVPPGSSAIPTPPPATYWTTQPGMVGADGMPMWVPAHMPSSPVPSPSPVQSTATTLPPMQPTPPPAQEQYQGPPAQAHELHHQSAPQAHELPQPPPQEPHH